MASNPPLSDALAQLRDELRKAQLQADPVLRLKVASIQLDLDMEFTEKIEGGVSVNVWSVLSGKAAADRSEARGHRLSLTIEPTFIDDSGDSGDLHVSTPPIADGD
ncbi:trypco2 family protein [Glycomyces artemisiae]|uniref:Trypsin-co-occurring domain-containing protein n=1 Tax=Glycomyces artemisiae TaxID=1076443 RepID=A0A2T0UPU6_9ACTN|nr:trypco2 family protein [Glycomyces artemisiae]PRY59857.1 hypothetical protein B0I28_103331 [Glycomyces artemisiae]